MTCRICWNGKILERRVELLMMSQPGSRGSRSRGSLGSQVWVGEMGGIVAAGFHDESELGIDVFYQVPGRS